jgi:hypothetical protein
VIALSKNGKAWGITAELKNPAALTSRVGVLGSEERSNFGHLAFCRKRASCVTPFVVANVKGCDEQVMC